MVVVSYSGKEINAKLVYYGPGLSGKTTNLEHVYQSVPSGSRGKMVSMKTRTDDLYVSPTRIENFGTAVVEAAAHGLPIITTRVGFPGELVLDSKTGLVLEPSLDEDSLARALDELLSDGGRRQEMGTAMRERVEELGLSLEDCVTRVIAAYRACLLKAEPDPPGSPWPSS